MPLTISALHGLVNQYDYFDKQIASLNLTNYFIIKNGEFAYNRSYSKGYPYGAIKRLDNYDQGVLSSLYICFKVKNINSDFIVQYFESGKWNAQVKLISGEGARNHGLLNLSSDDFFKIYIYFPKQEEEQKKIAKFFDLLNTKINIVENKTNALKKYKEGIINRWFNNIESKEKLSDLVFQKTSQLLTNQIKENSGIYPVYDASGKVYKYVDFFSNNCDSIAIIKYGSGCGRTFIAQGKHNVLGTMTEMVPLNPNDLLYIEAYTSSCKFKSICKKYTEIGTTPNLYFSDYSSSLVFYPKDRTKFTSLLFSFDVLESNLNEQLSLLEKIKKYLLKNMFI